MNRFIHLAGALCLGLCVAAPASADDFNWDVAGPADWSDAANWYNSTADAPAATPPTGGGGNHAFVNNGGTAVISSDINDIQDIFVGDNGGTGTLNQTGGSTFHGTGSWMFVGQDAGSVGTYNLSGGTANKDRLYIGQDGGTGTLNVSGTGVVASHTLVGVDGGTGTVNVTETGAIDSPGSIEFVNSTVTVTDDGLVRAGNEVWVGNGGGNSTTLNADSGTIEANTWFAIGRDGSTGVVNLSGDAVLRKVSVDDGNPEEVSTSEGSFIIVGGLNTGGSGTLNIAGNATVWSDTGLAMNETEGQAGTVNQSGGTVTVHDYAPRSDQPQFGSSIEIDPNGWGEGAYYLSGGSLSAETIDVGGGLLSVTGGELNATVIQIAEGGMLAGGGGDINADVVQDGGTTSPGASPGTMTITGNYSLNSGDLLMEIEGVLAGSEYDQLVVTGDVSLAGDLTLAGAYAPMAGDTFTLIDNQGANPVSGTFSGLGEGAIVSLNGVGLAVSYLGGDGNDVTLSTIPEPTSLALLALMGLSGVAARRR